MKAVHTELLSPAGSPQALDAALENGADAVYLGATAFNARMNAKNFTSEDLCAGIGRAHALGVSVYMTLNTLLLDREMSAVLDTAKRAYSDGVDALIVADLGAAREIHRVLPEFPLHASTQMSGHSTDMGRLLSSCGFSRMVLARETSAEDIRSFCENAPIEAEVFAHGALCVSHSGQCLFSSIVGGRSGNRGECAQPCRLPYNGSYPLSLKDLALARRIPELMEMGVASLKIEGRMKSPEYVGAVTKIYRRLLDERRGADEGEMARLAEIFSRGGFTEAYYTKRIGAEMLGVRSASDKEISRTLEPFAGLTKKAPISLEFTASIGKPMTLSVKAGEKIFTVSGKIPLKAEKAPTDETVVSRQITKFGGTVYEVQHVRVSIDEGLLIPLGWLNELRREALCRLNDDARASLLPRHGISNASSDSPDSSVESKRKTALGSPADRRTARFLSADQITEKARAYFDVCYLPLFSFDGATGANGVILPPVIYDGKRETVRSALLSALRAGAREILCTNLGQIGLIRETISESGAAGVSVIGDFRLGVMNRSSLIALLNLGLDAAILSPELALPQAKTIGGKSALIVYGRLPLMLLEKCVNIGKTGKKTGEKCVSCIKCHEGCGNPSSRVPSAVLVDRRQVQFPVLREWEHRNVIYNSVPTYMADRMDEILRARLTAHHYIFSIESPKEVDRVINAYKGGKSPEGAVRRLPSV